MLENQSADISSDRGSSERAQPQIEKLLSVIQDSPVILFEQDTNLLFTWVHDPGNGFDAAALVGKHDRDLVPPEDAARLTQMKQRVLDTGISNRQEVVVPFNGASLYFDLIVKPSYGSNNAVVGVSCVAIDITKYKQMERQYQMLFDRHPNPMWICDLETWMFLEVNDAALWHYGYSRSEFLAMRVIDLQAPETRARVTKFISSQQSKVNHNHCSEVKHRKKDGSIIDVEIDAHALTWRGRAAQCVLAKDISDRKLAEATLQEVNAELESKVMQRTTDLLEVNQLLVAEIVEKQQSLNEKEVLLKEVHHRVKNNLQIVSGLLTLRSRNSRDQNVKAMFDDCQNRIHSMALVHEKLYQSSDLSRIDFKSYLQDLIHSLIQSCHVDSQQIRFQVEVEVIYLSIEAATPCGLIINELIINSLKHAFPERRDGEIKLTCHKNAEDRVSLTVSDTGIGMPKGIEIDKTKSLGLQLVHSLTKQLKGTITLNRSQGTAFQLQFQELEKRRRF
jgi:PAS domain S-box-containing protein